ncbi:MAG: hypothetical protein SCJ94_11835 [Bacillota bacterium]|nr:hypothetical protein [Bacillota bacterium]MDW7730671.1 hypothetical protein [Bacillota bacterium]
MPLKKKLYSAFLIVIGIIGSYLILTSGRFELDPYSVIVALVVAGFIIYLYLLYFRHKT